MHKILKKWCLVALLALTACAAIPQLHHTQLVALNLGMEPEQTIERLTLPPIHVHELTIDNKNYLFHQYNLNNGLSLDTYFLAFENRQLKYWGYIDDFKRHPDSRLNRAIDAVLAQRQIPR